MNELLKGVEIFGIKELWLLKVIAVMTLTIILHFTVSYVLAKVLKATEKTRSHWDDALLLAAIKPVPYVIWVIGLTIALSIVASHNKDELIEFIPVFREVGITVCLKINFCRYT